MLQAYLATGDAAFDSPFATSSTETISGQASEIRIGATNSSAVNATVDDIRLNSASMPGPSGSGGAASTPTNTPTATATSGPSPTPGATATTRVISYSYNGDGALVYDGTTRYTQDLAAPLSQVLRIKVGSATITGYRSRACRARRPRPREPTPVPLEPLRQRRQSQEERDRAA